MAAVFPLDTSKPWTFNGVTYQYDASEDRWFVVSTTATDSIIEDITKNRSQIDVLDTIIDQEIENRTVLLDAAANKNNQQDASLDELSGRIDAIGAVVGILEFKGRYKYAIERTSEACEAAYGRCLIEADSSSDPVGARIECNRLYSDCSSLVGQPYDEGTFTSKGTTNVMSAVDEFIFSGSDLDGQALDWINIVEPTDYIEFVEKNNGDTSLYECIEEPKVSSTERSVRVKFLKETGDGDGNFNLQEEYDIRVIKASNGINIIEADARYVSKPYVVYFEDSSSEITPVHESGNLRNGELWFDTTSLELFVWNNNAWVAVSPPPSQDIVISSALDDISRISGDVTLLNQDVASIENFLETRKSIYYSDNNPTPVGPDGVTSTLKDGDIWVDSDDLELKFYSQGAWINPDRKSETPEHHHYAPANLRWKFSDDTETTPPPDGYFKRDKNKRWRFSFKTADGIDLGVDVFDDTDTHSWATQMSVWYQSSTEGWKLKAHYLLNEWRWNYNKNGIGHAEFHQSSAHGRLLTNGVTYNVTIGGWW